MACLGHLQPVAMLSVWRLLSRVNRPFGEGFSENFILTVSSYCKQSFKLLGKPYCEGRESAKGRSDTDVQRPTAKLRTPQVAGSSAAC